MQNENERNAEEMRKVEGSQVMASPKFKLKDKAGRGGKVIKLKEYFGFVPEIIVIQKVHGESNTIIVAAVLTEEMLAKELKMKSKDQPKPVEDSRVKEAVERIKNATNEPQNNNEVE